MNNPVAAWNQNGFYWILNVNTKGRSTPVGLSSMDFGTVPNTTREVVQNVQTILTTQLGSVPLYRQFGTNQNYVDYPVNVAMNMIVASVLLAITTWEKRAQVTGMEFSGDATGTTGLLTVTITISINLNAITDPQSVLSTSGTPIVVIDNVSGTPVVQTESLLS